MTKAKNPKGLLEACALYLSSKYPFTGKDLMDFTSKITAGAWKPSPGSVYPLLERLKMRGLIYSVSSERYIITDSGKQELNNLVLQLKNIKGMIDAVLDNIKTDQTK
ncbi:MAG: PadR family transcriptional regulator [Thaumarchaeota archaeon]|nr:PadR family transcriptional regulator [Nitrososphaerota archaeon]